MIAFYRYLFSFLLAFFLFGSICSASANETATQLDVICGGVGNDIGGVIAVNGNANYSSIVGGDSNMIRQNASYSAIVGGSHNTIDSGVTYATLGGGGGFANKSENRPFGMSVT